MNLFVYLFQINKYYDNHIILFDLSYQEFTYWIGALLFALCHQDLGGLR